MVVVDWLESITCRSRTSVVSPYCPLVALRLWLHRCDILSAPTALTHKAPFDIHPSRNLDQCTLAVRFRRIESPVCSTPSNTWKIALLEGPFQMRLLVRLEAIATLKVERRNRVEGYG